MRRCGRVALLVGEIFEINAIIGNIFRDVKFILIDNEHILVIGIKMS
jgi:hypothetical protein